MRKISYLTSMLALLAVVIISGCDRTPTRTTITDQLLPNSAVGQIDPHSFEFVDLATNDNSLWLAKQKRYQELVMTMYGRPADCPLLPEDRWSGLDNVLLAQGTGFSMNRVPTRSAPSSLDSPDERTKYYKNSSGNVEIVTNLIHRDNTYSMPVPIVVYHHHEDQHTAVRFNGLPNNDHYQNAIAIVANPSVNDSERVRSVVSATASENGEYLAYVAVCGTSNTPRLFVWRYDIDRYPYTDGKRITGYTTWHSYDWLWSKDLGQLYLNTIWTSSTGYRTPDNPTVTMDQPAGKRAAITVTGTNMGRIYIDPDTGKILKAKV